MGLIRGFRGLIRPSSFSISEQSASVKIGATYQIQYTLTPSDARNKKIIWTSSNTSVATVDNDGIVTPVTEGNCTITGRTEDLGYTDSIDIETYILHTTGVVIDETVLIGPGESKQINYTVLPEGASYPTLTWTSSNTSIATVDSNGVVTYVGIGSCTITATTVDGFSDTCACTCKVPVTGISLDKSTISLGDVGETSQITATVTPSNATVKTVTWSSSNTSVATVNSSGLVTAVADGTCTITATTVDGGFTATCSITCEFAKPVTQTFSYTGADQSYTIPYTQCYKLEAWGAGSYDAAGGYASGVMCITKGTVLRIMVGQSGSSGGTYGFGGVSNYSSSYNGAGLSGIFTGNTAITASDSSRALVIGGGAGSCSGRGNGGAGGGTSGNSGGTSGYGTQGGGGTQSGHGSTGNAGGQQFRGGNGSGSYGAGGGGGWWGGNGTAGDSSAWDDKGAGGGSGYVLSTMTSRTLTTGGGKAAQNHGCVKITSL